MKMPMDPITQDKMMEFQRKRYDQLRDAGADKMTLELIVNESAGGECPHCHKKWKRVDVSNACASFTYYDPACQCYDRCDVCGMSLHGVTFPNHHAERYACPRCGHQEPQKWHLTCVVCGMRGVTHEGKPYRFICGDCKKTQSKNKRNALDV
jgi:hypothetical protein